LTPTYSVIGSFTWSQGFTVKITIPQLHISWSFSFTDYMTTIIYLYICADGKPDKAPLVQNKTNASRPYGQGWSATVEQPSKE
jgi:hypothetical protein